MIKHSLPEASYQEAGPEEASLREAAHNQRTFPEQVAVTEDATQPTPTSQPWQELPLINYPCHDLGTISYQNITILFQKASKPHPLLPNYPR